MKKIKLILLLIFLFIPTIVLADGIENYYINTTILNNGDIEIEEYFNLTGYYNGMDRIINYRNINTPEFNPYSNSFGGSSIHNGDGITLEEIRGVEVDNNFDFNNVNGILSLGNQTGEGWFLTAEMVELIKDGITNIICVQPFACLPNHIVGKSVIKKIKSLYKDANIIAIDYDPGASHTNQINRIKLMLTVAKDNMKVK